MYKTSYFTRQTFSKNLKNHSSIACIGSLPNNGIGYGLSIRSQRALAYNTTIINEHTTVVGHRYK